MKILHICLASFYIDNYTYQENLLPKYHKKLGFEVEILASKVTFDKDGQVTFLKNKSNYINENGIKVYRINLIKFPFSKVFKKYRNTYNYLKNLKPDILFIHGLQFLDILTIKKYLMTNKIKVYIDNHADFNNSGKNFLSRNILHKILWRFCANQILPFTDKFYGVLPKRVDFLIDIYKIPKSKVELLVMGVDDELVEYVTTQNIINYRKKLNIDIETLVIVSGGKIDYNKTEIITLMRAVKNISKSNTKLILFGSVTPDYKKILYDLLDENIIFLGWLNPVEIYSLINDSNLVVFPGLHSVLWEQSVGIGVPCIFKYIDGYNHIDLDGNCSYLYESSIEHMVKTLNDIINNPEKIKHMKNVALNKGKYHFSYKKIAIDSLS